MSNVTMTIDGISFVIPHTNPIIKTQISKTERSYVSILPILTPITGVKKPLIIDILYSNLLDKYVSVHGNNRLTEEFMVSVEYTITDLKCNHTRTFSITDKPCSKRTIMHYDDTGINAYALEFAAENAQKVYVKHSGEEGSDVSCEVSVTNVTLKSVNTDGLIVTVYDSGLDSENRLNLPFTATLDYIPKVVDIRFTFRGSVSPSGSMARTVDEPDQYYLLGFKINKHEKDSYKRVVYTEGATGMVPISVGSRHNPYGSFSTAWFVETNEAMMVIPRDDYYLNPNDYTKHFNNDSPTGVSDVNVNGNAMSYIEKIWMKLWEDDDWIYCNFCNERFDTSYTDTAFITDSGEQVDGFYISAFECALINGKLRSLMGQKPTFNLSDEDIHNAIKANGDNYEELSVSRWNLINAILIMLGKDTDLRKVYGKGNSSSTRISGETAKTGQFYRTDDPNKSMKAMHIENYMNIAYKMFSDNNDTSIVLTDNDPDYTANYTGVFMTCT